MSRLRLRRCTMRRIILSLLALCLATAPVVADPLPEGVVARIGSVHFWDRGFHVALAFSPDGKTLATGGENLCVWDVATGKCVFRRPVKNHALVEFLPDGKSLRVVEEAIAHLVDARTGTPLGTQPLERKPAKDDAGAVSAHGRFAAFLLTDS